MTLFFLGKYTKLGCMNINAET
uniref:Uncharacterized protein n=1 Tax=Arundo donax TaxID=35708 RepID=A0A0A9G250_ARUDO